jgi:hypothetical protein
MPKFGRAICKRCNTCFIKEQDDQDCCSFLCNHRYRGSPTGRYTCCVCEIKVDVPFTSDAINPDVETTCSANCYRVLKLKKSPNLRKGIGESTKTEQFPVKKTKEQIANEKWASTHYKPRKPNPPGLSDKIECSRVFKKGAWDHYCKGRKWDRI